MSGTPFLVRSADGTSIAVWVDGSGPPLVLVHGAVSHHTTFAPLVRELHNKTTTFAMDRRGRGASSDGAGEYSIEREFEDVAAVVDVVAVRAGQSVALWGHSYGANCGMGGAARSDNIDHVVLYEPGLGTAYPPGSIEAVAAGDYEAALVALLVGIVKMSEREVDFMRSSPLWSARLANVPTMPRELRVEDRWVYRTNERPLSYGTTSRLPGLYTGLSSVFSNGYG